MNGPRLLSSLLLVFALALPTRAEWHAADAPLRFTFRLTQPPTHASAGYFAFIPNGGILPGPYPVTRVVASTGAALKSYCLWQNQATGMGIVFEAPATGNSVHVYVAGAAAPATWSPATGLTPSAILCTNPDFGDLQAARALARLGAVGPRVHYRQNPVHRRAPLCIQGDLSGRPWPASFYLLAYLDVKAPGRTWLAPMTLTGQAETMVDGTPLLPVERIDKWGGTGQYMDLAAGLHRLEVFCACTGRGTFNRGHGLYWMTWAPANASLKELGGVRSDKVPHAGTSKWASRVVRSDEIVRSGRCTLQETRARDGTPVAISRGRATHVYWFHNETPVIRYELSAFAKGNPDDTVYTWSFDGKRALEGAATAWLFPGTQDSTFSLTATAGKKRSTCTRPLFAHATVRTSLQNPADRAAFREACLNMVRATPAGANPTASWDEGMWNNLFRTIGFGEGERLLATLFTDHWEALRKGAPAKRLATLQDRFIFIAPTIDPESAAKWILRFEQAAADDRRTVLQLKRAEVLMYYLDNVEAARGILQGLARRRDEVGERARIRLGDAELLAGKLNEATALYGDVQNRYRANQEKGKVADWKMQAILEVSASETMRAYLEQHALEEAYTLLGDWERQFPLSKVSGDLAVLEAELFMALGHHRRARVMLEAYCKQVDASSFLPDALGSLLVCMLELAEPANAVKAFCEDARKRLEFHPQAERFEQRLRIIKSEQSDDGTRAATPDTL